MATGGEPAARALLELIYSGVRAQTVYVAAKLGLADRLAAGPLPAARLAAEVGADPVALRRFLRLLVGVGVFAGDDRAGYSLTELGELLRTGVAASMRDLAITTGELSHRSWAEPLHTAMTGEQSFRHVFGMPLFDYLAEHPEQARTFDGAMASGAAFFAAVPAVYDFSGASTVVDIGGGRGALLTEVLLANPDVRGVLYDVAHVIDAARPHLEAAGVADRCERVAGNFATAVPPGGDVYLLSRVLHDWDDETCHTILRNCRTATAPGARLLIIERVIQDQPTLALEWDVHMMMLTGGLERSVPEYAALLEPHSFRVAGTLSLPLDVNILVTERI